jgi:acyl carrier protein
MTADVSALEAAVKAAWVNAYGLDSWEENRAFDEEGSDSLQILAVILDIEDALGVPIQVDIVSMEMTGRELIRALSRLLNGAPAAKAPDDRPVVFLFSCGMNSEQEASLREQLADWLRFVAIDASHGAARAAEEMLRSHPAGAINIVATQNVAAPATDAAEQLTRKGYRRGFQCVLDLSSDAQSMSRRIVDAFIESRDAPG